MIVIHKYRYLVIAIQYDYPFSIVNKYNVLGPERRRTS
jgi:hypothetical protein